MLNPECAENVQDCGNEEQMSEQKINILYGRLSVEDDRDSESNSIVNQRALLEEYAERNGLVPYVFVSDDGFSGTGWKRPGWLKVIEEIENDNGLQAVTRTPGVSSTKIRMSSRWRVKFS